MLKNQLIKFLTSYDDEDYLVQNIQSMIGEDVKISKTQAKAEAIALKQTFERENFADEFDIPNKDKCFAMLEEILFFLSERLRLSCIC